MGIIRLASKLITRSLTGTFLKMPCIAGNTSHSRSVPFNSRTDVVTSVTKGRPHKSAILFFHNGALPVDGAELNRSELQWNSASIVS
jgi:hypothetical protein